MAAIVSILPRSLLFRTLFERLLNYGTGQLSEGVERRWGRDAVKLRHIRRVRLAVLINSCQHTQSQSQGRQTLWHPVDCARNSGDTRQTNILVEPWITER